MFRIVEAQKFLAYVILGFAANRPLDASQEAAIHVVWADPAMLELKLPPAGRQTVEDEVAAIYREIGIEVIFPEERVDEESAAPSFQVVLLARSSAGFGLPGEAMGAILEKDPARNTAFVFLPAVMKSLRHALPEDMKMIHDARKARLFAKALGRVVAHEIAHVLDAELPHGSEDDLMSAVLTPRLLQQHRLTFDAATGERLRERVSRLRGDYRAHPKIPASDPRLLVEALKAHSN